MAGERLLSWRKEPTDGRDLVLPMRMRVMVAPPAVDLRQAVVEVLDQGHTGSCVAHATAQALRTAMRLDSPVGPPNPPLPSRNFLYAYARFADGQTLPLPDDGTFLRSAFRVAHTMGFCTEQDSPWDDHDLGRLPPYSATRLAFDQRRVDAYYKLADDATQRQTALCETLAAGNPVAFGMSVDDRIFDVASLDPYDFKGPSVGGHALCAVGYNESGLLVCNSWGTGWGEGGFFTLGWSTVGTDVCDDFWVAKLAPYQGEIS